MSQKWNGIDRRNVLRAEAEALVGNLSPDENTANTTEILLHELLVHKVELEMQNEELRRAHNELEEARDRYIDLYEFAPVGYITINREGLISEINLTGSTLLGVDRTKLIKRRFSTFVALQDKDLWHRLFMNMMQHPTGEKQEFCLEMTRADGTLFYAHFDCLRRETLDTPPMLRVALTDISRLKLALQE
jgi:PAS domain S-box-containing protein